MKHSFIQWQYNLITVPALPPASGQKTNEMEVYDYQLSEHGLWISAEGLNTTAALEEVAAVLYGMGLVDGYTGNTEQPLCIMEDRPGFADVCTVQEVWQTIGGELQEQVAKKCLQ